MNFTPLAAVTSVNFATGISATVFAIASGVEWTSCGPGGVAGRLNHQTATPAATARDTQTSGDQRDDRLVAAPSGASGSGSVWLDGGELMGLGRRENSDGVRGFQQNLRRLNPVNPSHMAAKFVGRMAPNGLIRKLWPKWILLFLFWT